jgi:regulator of extracellular matrix RemA (YlzA/DUF370 family)
MGFQDAMLTPVGAGVGQAVTPAVQQALSHVLPESAPVTPEDMAATRKRDLVRAQYGLARKSKKLGTGWRLILGALGFTGGALIARRVFVRGRARSHGESSQKRRKHRKHVRNNRTLGYK